jgi:hypothetical protein
VKAAREHWIDGQNDLEPERLIFIDESGAFEKGPIDITNHSAKVRASGPHFHSLDPADSLRMRNLTRNF